VTSSLTNLARTPSLSCGLRTCSWMTLCMCKQLTLHRQSSSFPATERRWQYRQYVRTTVAVRVIWWWFSAWRATITDTLLQTATSTSSVRTSAAQFTFLYKHNVVVYETILLSVTEWIALTPVKYFGQIVITIESEAPAVARWQLWHGIERLPNNMTFWATVYKTVRPVLSCLSVSLSCPVLSVCNVGVLSSLFTTNGSTTRKKEKKATA